MKRNNATITVALSKAQIHEILFVIEGRTHLSWDLKHAQKTLRRMVRDTKASNDPDLTQQDPYPKEKTV